MRTDDRSRRELVAAALEARMSGVTVSAPPFEAILARAQGQPPTPPAGSPSLSLPSAGTGPGAGGGGALSGSPAAGATTAVGASSPADVSVSESGSELSNDESARAEMKSESAQPQATSADESTSRLSRLLKRSGKAVAVGSLVCALALVVLVVTGDDPALKTHADRLLASLEVDLDTVAEERKVAVAAEAKAAAMPYVAGRCHDKIAEAVEQVRAGDVVIDRVETFNRVGVVVVKVQGSPIPVPTPWLLTDGEWKLQLCSALRWL